MSKAIEDVIAERERQQSVEGWTPEHDDTHAKGEMARAAGVYALASVIDNAREASDALDFWPWDIAWFKPTDERRCLVKAGALILAEIERLDRAEAMEAEANQIREVSISHRNRAEALEESLKTVLASLVATTSLIIRAEDLKVKPSKAVASDKMFTQMLKDYDKATIAGRAALSLPEHAEDRRDNA